MELVAIEDCYRNQENQVQEKKNLKGQNNKQVQSTNEHYQCRAGMCSNIFYTATADAEGMREKRLQKTTGLPFTDSTPFCNEWLNRALKCISDYTT